MIHIKYHSRISIRYERSHELLPKVGQRPIVQTDLPIGKTNLRELEEEEEEEKLRREFVCMVMVQWYTLQKFEAFKFLMKYILLEKFWNYKNPSSSTYAVFILSNYGGQIC